MLKVFLNKKCTVCVNCVVYTYVQKVSYNLIVRTMNQLALFMIQYQAKVRYCVLELTSWTANVYKGVFDS